MTSAAEPTLETLSDRARGLLQGALDIHVHADPDPYAERKVDFSATVARAREAGLAGLVLKSHEYPTQPLAWTLDREFSGIDVYGGVALDWGVGGLNPEAASITLRIGGKVVWMPTFDALHWRGYRPGGFNSPQEPISVLDEDGALLPVCHDILDVIASHDAVLASGHLSPAETQAILGEGLARGMRCVITHASFWTPVELQQEIVAKGGYIEQCAIAVAGEDGEEAWPDLLRQVREVGPERVILSSDHGQASNPEPVAALATFGERFVEAGFGEAEVRRMLSDNPRRLLAG